MSRHRKVKALDYDGEYDDYYGALDDYDEDDEDFDGEAFEAQYLSSVKKPASKQVVNSDDPKAARFEYSGKSDKNSKVVKKNESVTKKTKRTDLTIQESFNAEQLDKLTKDYNKSLHIEAKASKSAQSSHNEPHSSTQAAQENKKRTLPNQPTATRPLSTLTDKRRNLKEQLNRSPELSIQEKANIKKLAAQTRKEYEDSLQGTKPKINLVVVGHVDAGKSTLVGHLLFKLGQVSGKQMHRYEVDSQRSGKSSFKFAWALDETDEERSRGVTIDIAATQFETPNRDVVLLDAPGHVDFVPAVISGAAQADAALLVVDATRGEFETGFSNGGQTREHTFLVRSFGAKSLIVVINKMDTVDWSYERYSDIVDQLKPFLKQAGFNCEKDVQFVVCSGLTGENLTENRMKAVLKGSSHPQLEGDMFDWTKMPCLLEAIDRINVPERLVDKPTRVCVSDIFKGLSSGVSLSAKVLAGKIEAKQKLLLLPPNETGEVKQVEVRNIKENRAFAGDIVTMIVTGIDMNKYYRGGVFCDPLMPCRVTNRFQARIIMFQNANTLLIKGTPIEVHINGSFESGEVRHLISLLNKTTGELIQRRPRCVAKNSSAIIQLRLARVVCCELYEDNKDLGRFMLRAHGKTVAAGLITKVKSAHLNGRGKGGERGTRMMLK